MKSDTIRYQISIGKEATTMATETVMNDVEWVEAGVGRLQQLVAQAKDSTTAAAEVVTAIEGRVHALLEETDAPHLFLEVERFAAIVRDELPTWGSAIDDLEDFANITRLAVEKARRVAERSTGDA
jgi:hypothetical protein